MKKYRVTTNRLKFKEGEILYPREQDLYFTSEKAPMDDPCLVETDILQLLSIGWLEEVEEKEYRILHQKHENTLTSSGMIFKDVIYSVLRLSDGVAFTVGDEVLLPSEETPRKITRFSIDADEIIVWFGGVGGPLTSIQPAPKREPLFVTEDGKELFDPNEYVFIVNQDWSFHIDKAVCIFDSSRTNYKIFSNREAAEEYVINNKPVWTTAEIREATLGDISKEWYTKTARERCGFTKPSPCVAHDGETEKEEEKL